MPVARFSSKSRSAAAGQVAQAFFARRCSLNKDTEKYKNKIYLIRIFYMEVTCFMKVF